MRRLDVNATEAARDRHAAGIARLEVLFRISPALKREIYANGPQADRDRPVRTRQGCPPVRPPEYAQRRRLRKIAHEARRRNRP